MADEILSSLEKYIMSSDKQAALQYLTADSDIRLYLEGNALLDADPSSSKLSKLLKTLKKNPELAKKLEARKLIRTLESSEDPKTVKTLNKKFFEYAFDYEAPRTMQTQEVEQYSDTLKLEFPLVNSASATEKAYNSLSKEGKYKVVISKTNDVVFKKLLTSGEL